MTISNETIDLLLTRRSAKALTMVGPDITPEQIETLLRAGARVPDHGKLAPWRFVLFQGAARARFGEVLRRAYETHEDRANDDQLDFEAHRFMRAPLVIAVISHVTPEHKVPEWEQLLSSGAVCQNMLVAATAMGLAAQWLTEWYAYDEMVWQALGLRAHERVAGFLYFGHPSVPNDERPRPVLSEITTDWKG